MHGSTDAWKQQERQKIRRLEDKLKKTGRKFCPFFIVLYRFRIKYGMTNTTISNLRFSWLSKTFKILNYNEVFGE